MAVISVTYARLYNLGNDENERLEAQATVEDDAAGAFAQARGAVEEEHARMEAAREAERVRQQEEYNRQRQEQVAAIKARNARESGDLPY